MRAKCPIRLVLLDIINLTILEEEYSCSLLAQFITQITFTIKCY